MFKVQNLGNCRFDSPLSKFNIHFIDDKDKILYSPWLEACRNSLKNCMDDPIALELAGPKEKLFFNPETTKVAIVTCGGICPGLNDVIRGLYFELYYRYGIKEVYGIKYGYAGMIEENDLEPILLKTSDVDNIHEIPGTIIGSSRGSQDLDKVVDFLEKRKFNILFTIGGDGTLKGASEIARRAILRGYPLSVVGIPKTIDNDISYISKSFGFESAVQFATKAINAAHYEARAYFNGVGLVKLMGRYSGFIAVHASLAISDANFVLIPEVKFDLDGENGFLNHLFKRLQNRHHAVVVVAEGAGQSFFDPSTLGTDASGNQKLGDIGTFLKSKIQNYSKEHKIPVDVKYIDPSYMIRSTNSVASDSIYCLQLAQNAVHSAMAGKTDMVIGYHHNNFTNIPISTTVSKRKQIDPNSQLWMNLLDATGQPYSMVN